MVDAWAVGVLAYELIIGRPPFDKGHKKLTIAEIVNGEPVIPNFVSQEAANFIRWALTKDQLKRPGVKQLSEHPWILIHMKAPTVKSTVDKHLQLEGRANSFVQPKSIFVQPAGSSGSSSSSLQPEEVVS